MTRRLACFVASAFGRADVERIYDQAVKPVLRDLKIRPVRVDRVEHNEDIDHKIFELLDSADFCLADLTYARPSVYYEAGHAAGKGKPVIYTARNDHFRAQDADPEGLLRIHFDLQMKNVISWAEPNERFKTRLAARVRHVTAPILRALAREAAKEQEAARFAAIAPNLRIEEIATRAASMLRSRGFKLEPEHTRYEPFGRHLEASLSHSLGSSTVHFWVMARITKADVEVLRMSLVPWGAEAPKPASVFGILCSLESRPRGLAMYLASFDRLPNGRFTRSGRNDSTLQVLMLDALESYDDFTSRFAGVLDEADGSTKRADAPP